jgi:putative transposase
VAQMMAEQHLRARPKRRRHQTTRPGRGRWRAPDLEGRDFAAATINQRWYGDGSEIDTEEGKLFFDSVLDVRSRRIVGLMSEHHDTDCAYCALAIAVAVRGGQKRLPESSCTQIRSPDHRPARHTPTSVCARHLHLSRTRCIT